MTATVLTEIERPFLVTSGICDGVGGDADGLTVHVLNINNNKHCKTTFNQWRRWEIILGSHADSLKRSATLYDVITKTHSVFYTHPLFSNKKYFPSSTIPFP